MVELEFFFLSLTKLHRLMHHKTACAPHCMCAIDSLFGVYVLSSNIDVFDFAVKPLIFNYMALIIIYRCDTCIERGCDVRCTEFVCVSFWVCVCCVVYTLVILPNSKSDHINNETHQ